MLRGAAWESRIRDHIGSIEFLKADEIRHLRGVRGWS